MGNTSKVNDELTPDGDFQRYKIHETAGTSDNQMSRQNQNFSPNASYSDAIYNSIFDTSAMSEYSMFYPEPSFLNNNLDSPTASTVTPSLIMGAAPDYKMQGTGSSAIEFTTTPSATSSKTPSVRNKRSSVTSISSFSTDSPTNTLSKPPALSSFGPFSSTIDLPRRDAHMASEQRRRATMQRCFEELRNLLPSSELRKPSKVNVLQSSVNYIRTLEGQCGHLQKKVNFLWRENKMLQDIYSNAKNVDGITIEPRQLSAGGGVDSAKNFVPIMPQKKQIMPRSGAVMIGGDRNLLDINGGGEAMLLDQRDYLHQDASTTSTMIEKNTQFDEHDYNI